MAKATNKLTKVAKGIAFGDVSNNAVRNILTQISKELYDDFTVKCLNIRKCFDKHLRFL